MISQSHWKSKMRNLYYSFINFVQLLYLRSRARNQHKWRNIYLFYKRFILLLRIDVTNREKRGVPVFWGFKRWISLRNLNNKKIFGSCGVRGHAFFPGCSALTEPLCPTVELRKRVHFVENCSMEKSARSRWVEMFDPPLILSYIS